MNVTTGLHLAYQPADTQEERAGTLATARYGLRPPTLSGAAAPEVAVRMAVLSGPETLLERWSSAEPVRYGQCGAVRLAHTAELTFGAIEAKEPPDGAQRTGLETATEWAYRQVHAALEASGHAHLVRVWNYLPRINQETHGLERYRQFNIARQRALIASGRPIGGNVPAASALGSAQGPLVVYFLAARRAPRCLENPRQVSAYHYPREYGERSPSFSRATLIEHAGREALFISGTASIVGHRTLHAGDAAAQTRETLANIEALLGELPGFTLERLIYKIYVRHRSDLQTVRSEVDAALGSGPPRVYLQADVCRADLDVEIEAAGGCAGP
ncbi:MAG: hypothetical protein ACP5P4_12750 [Steroidobacteraceae bacterium]